MRIGIFIDEYLPKMQGVITSTISYKRALEELGHTVYIIAPAEPDYTDDDPHVIRLKSFDPLIFNKTRLALLYPGLAKKLSTYQFDIVHSQTQFNMGILAHEVSKLLKVPHISTMHTVFAELIEQYPVAGYSAAVLVSVVFPAYFKVMPKFERPSLNHPRKIAKDQIWKAGNIFFNHTDGVIAPSSHVADSLQRYGLTKPCYVLPNGLHREHFLQLAAGPLPEGLKKEPGDIWLVTVGRLSGEKRQDALIRALPFIDDARLKLVVVGSGPVEEELHALAAKLGVAERVIFAGHQPQETVAAIMRHSDIFSLVSYKFDNQPMVILEAITIGLPVVYCDPALKEGLQPDNALLAESPEPEAIAASITTVAADAKRRQAMAVASKKLSSEFDIVHLTKDLVEIYQKTVLQKQKKATVG